MQSNQKVCQYYLRGQCRFGDKCKNLHQKQTFNSTPTVSSPSSSTGNISALIKKHLLADLDEWPIYKYSTFSPDPQKAPFVQFMFDISPEEFRCKFYEYVKYGNNFQMYLNLVGMEEQKFQTQVKEIRDRLDEIVYILGNKSVAQGNVVSQSQTLPIQLSQTVQQPHAQHSFQQHSQQPQAFPLQTQSLVQQQFPAFQNQNSFLNNLSNAPQISNISPTNLTEAQRLQFQQQSFGPGIGMIPELDPPTEFLK